LEMAPSPPPLPGVPTSTNLMLILTPRPATTKHLTLAPGTSPSTSSSTHRTAGRSKVQRCDNLMPTLSPLQPRRLFKEVLVSSSTSSSTHRIAIIPLKVLHTLFTNDIRAIVYFATNQSAFVRGRCEVSSIQQGCSILDCSSVAFPYTYLGLPISDKKLRRCDFMLWVDEIAERLPNWKTHLLHLAGGQLLCGLFFQQFLSTFSLQ
jgi:hypothetical protein